MTLCLLAGVQASAEAVQQVVSVDTPNTSLAFMADKDDFLLHRYFGEHLDTPEAVAELVIRDDLRYATFEAPAVFGGYYAGEPSVAATHADGNMTTDLRFLGHEQIRMKDSAYPLFWFLSVGYFSGRKRVLCKAFSLI